MSFDVAAELKRVLEFTADYSVNKITRAILCTEFEHAQMLVKHLQGELTALRGTSTTDQQTVAARLHQLTDDIAARDASLEEANREMAKLRDQLGQGLHSRAIATLQAQLNHVIADREVIGRKLMVAQEVLIARNEDREQFEMLKEHVRDLEAENEQLREKISSCSKEMRTKAGDNDQESSVHQTRYPNSRTSKRDSSDYRANGESDPMAHGTRKYDEPSGRHSSQARDSGTRYREGSGNGRQGDRFPSTDNQENVEQLDRGSRVPHYNPPQRPQSPSPQWVPSSKDTTWTKSFLAMQSEQADRSRRAAVSSFQKFAGGYKAADTQFEDWIGTFMFNFGTESESFQLKALSQVLEGAALQAFRVIDPIRRDMSLGDTLDALYEQLVDNSPGRKVGLMTQLQGIRQGEKEKMAEFIPRLELLSRQALSGERYDPEISAEILIPIFTQAIYSASLRKKILESTSSSRESARILFQDLKKQAMNFELIDAQYRELELTRQDARGSGRNGDPSLSHRVPTAKYDQAPSPDDPNAQCHMHPKLQHTNEHCFLQQRQREMHSPPQVRSEPRVSSLTAKSHSPQLSGRIGSITHNSNNFHPLSHYPTIVPIPDHLRHLLPIASNRDKSEASPPSADISLSGRVDPFPPPGKASACNLGHSHENSLVVEGTERIEVAANAVEHSFLSSQSRPAIVVPRHTIASGWTKRRTLLPTPNSHSSTIPPFVRFPNSTTADLFPSMTTNGTGIPKLLELPFLRPSTVLFPHRRSSQFSSQSPSYQRALPVIPPQYPTCLSYPNGIFRAHKPNHDRLLLTQQISTTQLNPSSSSPSPRHDASILDRRQPTGKWTRTWRRSLLEKNAQDLRRRVFTA
jgi:hypothetical protein